MWPFGCHRVRDHEQRVSNWVCTYNQPPLTPAALGAPTGSHEELWERPSADDAVPETGKDETRSCSSASSSTGGTVLLLFVLCSRLAGAERSTWCGSAERLAGLGRGCIWESTSMVTTSTRCSSQWSLPCTRLITWRAKHPTEEELPTNWLKPTILNAASTLVQRLLPSAIIELTHVTCQSSLVRLFPRASEMTLHDHLLVSVNSHSWFVHVTMTVLASCVTGHLALGPSCPPARWPSSQPGPSTFAKEWTMVGDHRALVIRHLHQGLLDRTRRCHLYDTVQEPAHTSAMEDATNIAHATRCPLGGRWDIKHPYIVNVYFIIVYSFLLSKQTRNF